MGWTDSEQLIVVLEDGVIRLYDIHGEYNQFSLGKVKVLPSLIITITIITITIIIITSMIITVTIKLMKILFLNEKTGS